MLLKTRESLLWLTKDSITIATSKTTLGELTRLKLDFVTEGPDQGALEVTERYKDGTVKRFISN